MRGQTENWWEQRIEYDDDAESYHVAYERSELVSTNVVLSVAAIENAEPTELPPLASTVDPDALDSLFADGVSGRISFSYAGYDVTVHAGERLEIVPGVDIALRKQRD